MLNKIYVLWSFGFWNFQQTSNVHSPNNKFPYFLYFIYSYYFIKYQCLTYQNISEFVPVGKWLYSKNCLLHHFLGATIFNFFFLNVLFFYYFFNWLFRPGLSKVRLTGHMRPSRKAYIFLTIQCYIITRASFYNFCNFLLP